jgi:hypothetical protein
MPGEFLSRQTQRPVCPAPRSKALLKSAQPGQPLHTDCLARPHPHRGVGDCLTPWRAATPPLLRGRLAEVLVGSIAGISGPTTAAAMAASFGRRDLITPGILCGLLGFASATFVGLAAYHVLDRF